MIISNKFMNPIPAENLLPIHFAEYPVWTYLNDDEFGETCVIPVETLPVSNLAGCVVGTTVVLANGMPLSAVMSNVDSVNAKKTEHFLNLTVFFNQEAFRLSRYHDPDYSRNGPNGLSAFLNLSLEQIYPISYNLSNLSAGDLKSLVGMVERIPHEVLNDDQLMKLIFT